ncbi:YheU family protein [Rheinheimera sp.]|uniref:YheU family protein n=1 Tax=Rheinheimera sp. TaxID=1869214 RepID=UPI0027B93919|nr:YheU family protein [Rheinheimera sp.]
MLIPFQQLNPDTLTALIEAFVLREGTDYGDFDVSLQNKVQMVLQQLQQGKVVIVYSELEESVDLMTVQDYRQLLAADEQQ